MTDTVTLPFWLFVVLCALAAWAALSLLFLPGVRWFLHRRINRVLEQVHGRLHVELTPFKLTRRQVLIDRLFHDPEVQAAAGRAAAERGEPLPEVWRRVDRYAREIVPSFNAYLYFRVGYALARGLAKLLYRVRIGYADEAALAAVDPKSTIVFVMNHRSNMDYVLVAFLAAERAALSYAVGEWARVWPLQQLVRAMGAFFVRRNSGDALYRTVLARYVRMATDAGLTQAVFPEGGLTVDGRLRAPRFGLLDYMLKGFDEREGAGRRDLVFVPVGLNYDRVLEDRSQLLKLRPEAPR
ncbi:MAG TPA: 1-acyl-sn-glycerol-3-phosphate acyltransferase, partial [Burkholderiales bacterium]